MVIRDTPGEGEIWELNTSQKLQLPTCDSPGGSTAEQFHVLLNYFGHLLLGILVSDYRHFEEAVDVRLSCRLQWRS